VDTSGIIDGAAYAERWADLNVGQRTGGVANTGDVQNEMTIAKLHGCRGVGCYENCKYCERMHPFCLILGGIRR
jgi:hypothetical protein